MHDSPVFHRPTFRGRIRTSAIPSAYISSRLLGYLPVIVFVMLVGCSRNHYRQQADHQVYSLIDCASEHPDWQLEDYTIQANPQSRYFDPNCPDAEPMPPDDPTAHRLMHCVDGKRGWPYWAEDGCTQHVENPAWLQYLSFDEDGELVLDQRAAVRLAYLNSPDYQTARENLYLSALDVTYQRFRFDTQFFGGHSLFYTSDGALRTGENELADGSTASMRKMTATGAELAVGMANSLVWQFAGPDDYSANTILDFSVVQPLLRTGGRAVVLESLTQSERNLLANIRQMVRFRKGFYAQIVAGGSNVGTPSRGRPTGRSSRTTSAGGYLGLLEEQVRIRNTRANVASLEDSLNRIAELYNKGRIPTRLQVEQTRQSLLRSQSQLIQQKAAYETRLDNYLMTLGLPPDLKLSVQDDLLNQFELIDPELNELQDRVDAFLAELRDTKAPIPGDYQSRLRRLFPEIREQIAQVYDDVERLENKVPDRIQNLEKLVHRAAIAQGEVDRSAVDIDAFRERVQLVTEKLPLEEERLEGVIALLEPFAEENREMLREKIETGDIDASTRRILEDLKLSDLAMQEEDGEDGEDLEMQYPEELQLEGQEDELLKEQMEPYRQWLKDIVNKLANELMLLALLQARARLDSITLMPVEIKPEEALEIAAEHRLDWMNSRAALVDTWRRINIAANDLMSDLDVTFSGEMSTPTNNPVAFDARDGRLRVGLEFDAPLTRLQERNSYREAILNYQRARRTYYTFVDQVNADLRSTLRQINVSQLDFEVQRAAVLVAIVNVDLAQLNLEKPLAKGQKSTSDNNLARDLINALTDLLSAQNNLLGVWVDYQTQRMTLDLDMGTMQLDNRGLWVDPGEITGAGVMQQNGMSTTPAESLSLPDYINDNVEALPPEIQGEPMLPPQDVLPLENSPMLEELDELPSENPLLEPPEDRPETGPQTRRNPLQPPPVLEKGLEMLEALQRTKKRDASGENEEKTSVTAEKEQEPVSVAARPDRSGMGRGPSEGDRASEAKAGKKVPAAPQSPGPIRGKGEPVPLPEIKPRTVRSAPRPPKPLTRKRVIPASALRVSKNASPSSKAPLPPGFASSADSPRTLFPGLRATEENQAPIQMNR